MSNGNELIILTQEEAAAAIKKMVEEAFRSVADFDKGTWKAQCDTSSTQTSLTVEQLASELHISRTNAYALVKQTGFPSFSVGRKILVSRQGLQRWMENGGTRNEQAC
ncbi:MAG: helix-turn-helix domain-containing protein [Clostridia bacterium]|nr:helix-turn-helix domain-containing protein [Clostridia bacterium]